MQINYRHSILYNMCEANNLRIANFRYDIDIKCTRLPEDGRRLQTPSLLDYIIIPEHWDSPKVVIDDTRQLSLFSDHVSISATILALQVNEQPVVQIEA